MSRLYRLLASLVLFATISAPALADSSYCPATGLCSIWSTSAESSLVVKTGPGQLQDFTLNIGGTAGYVMVFDATAAPSDGSVTPRFCVPVQSNSTNGGVSVTWINPIAFQTGIVVTFSTTGCLSKTAANAAFISAEFK